MASIQEVRADLVQAADQGTTTINHIRAVEGPITLASSFLAERAPR